MLGRYFDALSVLRDFKNVAGHPMTRYGLCPQVNSVFQLFPVKKFKKPSRDTGLTNSNRNDRIYCYQSSKVL